MKDVIIEAFGEKTPCVIVVAGQYDTERVAIEARCKDVGDRWGVLTVNIPEGELAEDEIFVKDWSENAVWVNQVLEQCPDLFEDTGRRQPTGHTSAAIWKVKGELA